MNDVCTPGAPSSAYQDSIELPKAPITRACAKHFLEAIGQLAKLISERPQGSLPSNTESNPRKQINAITIQDEEGLVAPEPEPRQETVVSKGKGEVDHNDQKPVSKEYKPRVPYPNATRKDRTEEQFDKFLKLSKKLHINLPFIEALSQMPNAVKFLKELLTNKRKLDEASHVELNAEISSKNLHEPCSSKKKGPLYEERRLQIEKLDEWRTPKLRTHDKPKPRNDELNIAPNQLKVGDKVLVDTTDPRIATSEPNGVIPLTVVSIFPYGTVEVIHPKFSTFKAMLTPRARPCENRAKFYLNTGCDKWPRPCDMAVSKSVKPTRVCDTPMSINSG
ncbi:hypothetical protein GOBAR_AA19998 [Gossypium barbadense]|uniref:Uncharacterized protein n=1 Tax=Gossypium barbadense TaxID=3634 RepID=A0A2P5XBF4_GOSBA|nr:hypothetical protein GOBAR_AA19998 [Gossypium barbadense]